MKTISAENARFFVAPSGSDQFPGTAEKPFATLNRARKAVQEIRREGNRDDVLVLFREGTYRFAQTVVFGADDSAPDGVQNIYAAFPGEKPVFSGGIPIPARNWTKVENEPDYLPDRAVGKLWTAEVPEALENGIHIKTLYEGPEFLDRARGPGFSLLADSPGVDEEVRRDTLKVPLGTIRNWPDIGGAEVVVIPKWTWTMNILPIESVDEKQGIVKTAVPHTYPMRPNPHISESVYLENSLAVLDRPGEWMYDGNGRIYYWPKTGNPSDRIEYPALTELIRIEGNIDYEGPEDIPVKGIAFVGFTITHSERYPWHGKTGWGIQHDWEAFDRPTAMVRLRGAQGCTVERCRFTCSASTGLRLDLHCKANTVAGNAFDYLGCCGIVLCGYGPGLKDLHNGNRVSDNHVHHIGLVHWHSPGIFVWQSGDNEISHNHIHHTGYTGIVVSGRIRWDRDGEMECSRTIRWHETAEVVGPDYEQQIWHQAWYPDWKRRNPLYHGHGNVLEFNDIHDVMQIMGDGNGIYISGTGTGNIVRYNVIHDCPSHTMAEGLRCDDDQHDTVLHGNIIYNLGGFATGITIKGVTQVTNNIIACGLPEKTRRGYISLEVGPLFGSVIADNILYATSDRHALYYQGPRIHGEGPLPLLRDCEADNNIYWCTQDPSRCSRHLEIERQFGIERHSIVADPLFVDPQKGDFRLQDSSPVARTGFVSIDLEHVGPRDILPPDLR